MNSFRGSRNARSDWRVLLVGPPDWRARLDGVLDRLGEVDGETVRTATEARQRIATDARVDCVVSAYRLDDATGLELAESLDDPEPTFVLAPRASETVPDVYAANVSRVIPLDASEPEPAGSDRLARALAREREHDRLEREAAQFTAVAEDPDRFVAVLDADGTVRSLNDAAAAALNAPPDVFVGKRLWALPWRKGQVARREVQDVVREARDGTYSTFEGSLPTGDGELHAAETRKFEFRLQPAGDDRLLLQGSVLTEREKFEAELRASEELHRVTLNNMTDTVLVTNDAGEFTYVCPNVHFIFGYTVEEIYELGTIDELLGADLFDEEQLATDGVITNVETTAPDKDGDEHTLLVNVRNVSIRDGTKLYSCRDITKRKQREQALTQLQQTSRDLLYAETKADVARQIATDAATALTSDGVAVYQFDGGDNTLYPMAVSETLRASLGTLPTVSLGERTHVSRAFVEGQTITETGGESSSDSPDWSVEASAAIPLGEHGVLLVETGESDDHGEIDEEIGELLAATTEAAFDRLERERELRERDETLKEQNQRLSEINQVNEIIREIGQTVVHAETREQIERAVCDRLTADDRFGFAWIGETTAHENSLRPREWSGDDSEYLDRVSLSLGDEQSTAEPAVRAVQRRSMSVVPNVADQLHDCEWCKEAVSRNFNSVLSIPLVYDDVSFGTLTVYDEEPGSFSETVQAVFREFGETIGAAINSIQRKEALRSDSVYRLAYELEDSSSVLLRLADRFDCTLTVQSEISRTDTTLVFVAVDGASPDAVVDEATASVDVADGEVIRESDDCGLVTIEIRGSFVTSLLANHGATRRKLEATPQSLSLVIDVPDTPTLRSVDEMLSRRFAGVELVSQQKQTRAMEDDQQPESVLTDRQKEVAQVAYHSGYFDAERSVTGRDVAAKLDISHSAFYDHIDRVERKLFSTLFEQERRYITVE